jgi:hypothetical protein
MCGKPARYLSVDASLTHQAGHAFKPARFQPASGCLRSPGPEDGGSSGAGEFDSAQGIGGSAQSFTGIHEVIHQVDRCSCRKLLEVDETYIGGEELGLRGGRARGKKSLVGVAVERKEPRGYGRAA